jgi:hypothetical protein
MKLVLIMMVLGIGLAADVVRAAEDHAGADHAVTTQPVGHGAGMEPHPDLSANPAWARKLVMIAVGMFVAAIPIGILVRANMPEEVPLAAHDEHGPGEHTDQDTHGSPGHHGHGHGHGGGHH